MAKRAKMQLLRPLADVRAASGLLPDGRTSGNGATRTADAPQADASSRAEERAGASPEQQQRMKEQSDAELAGLRSAQAALEDASSKLRQLQDRFLAEAEEQLLTLSIDIAEKVLMQAIEAGRYEIDPIVKEALSRIPTNADVVVRLHPDDLDRSELSRQEEDSQTLGGIRFVADPAVNRAECLLQTSDGTVQSSVQEHLADIAGALKSQE